ncbi:hypothetical protein KNHN1_55600 (plasmid) [Pseudomonas guariconensis]
MLMLCLLQAFDLWRNGASRALMIVFLWARHSSKTVHSGVADAGGLHIRQLDRMRWRMRAPICEKP